MAAPKKKKGIAGIESLTPNAISVVIKGEEVRVAINREENCIMNMVMAAEMRSMIHAAVKKYRDDDTTLTPKEIRDLAGAARDIATFSAEIYAAAEPISNAPKPIEPEATDINFDSLHNVPTVEGVNPPAGPEGPESPEGQSNP